MRKVLIGAISGHGASCIRELHKHGHSLNQSSGRYQAIGKGHLRKRHCLSSSKLPPKAVTAPHRKRVGVVNQSLHVKTSKTDVECKDMYLEVKEILIVGGFLFLLQRKYIRTKLMRWRATEKESRQKLVPLASSASWQVMRLG